MNPVRSDTYFRRWFRFLNCGEYIRTAILVLPFDPVYYRQQLYIPRRRHRNRAIRQFRRGCDFWTRWYYESSLRDYLIYEHEMRIAEELER